MRNCNCTSTNSRVYRGETVIGDFTLYDDDGVVITAVDDAVLLLTDLSKRKIEPVALRMGDGLDFSNGNFRFVLSPEDTKTLPAQVGLEIKVTVGGITRIAMRDFITLVDNQVNAY